MATEEHGPFGQATRDRLKLVSSTHNEKAVLFGLADAVDTLSDQVTELRELVEELRAGVVLDSDDPGSDGVTIGPAGSDVEPQVEPTR